MGSNFLIDVLSRVFHVGTAICLAGGTVYALFALLPALKSLNDSSRADLVAGLNRYWKRFVHGGTALLLVTGFYNYFQQMKLHKGDGLYHGLIGAKMLLAFAVFFIAAALVGNSPKFESFRANRKRYLGALVLLVAIIVAISGFLKVRGVPVEVKVENQTVMVLPQ